MSLRQIFNAKIKSQRSFTQLRFRSSRHRDLPVAE